MSLSLDTLNWYSSSNSFLEYHWQSLSPSIQQGHGIADVRHPVALPQCQWLRLSLSEWVEWRRRTPHAVTESRRLRLTMTWLTESDSETTDEWVWVTGVSLSLSSLYHQIDKEKTYKNYYKTVHINNWTFIPIMSDRVSFTFSNIDDSC